MLTRAYQAAGKPYPFRAEWEACQQTPEYADYVRKKNERREERGRGGGKGRPMPIDTQTIEVATAPTHSGPSMRPPTQLSFRIVSGGDATREMRGKSHSQFRAEPEFTGDGQGLIFQNRPAMVSSFDCANAYQSVELERRGEKVQRHVKSMRSVLPEEIDRKILLEAVHMQISMLVRLVMKICLVS